MAKKTAKKTSPKGSEFTLHVPDLDMLIPGEIGLTINAPDLAEALKTVVTAAIEHDSHGTPRDPEEVKLEQARVALEQDRMKLQWEEHKLRVREFEAQVKEREERIREREEDRLERERERGEREKRDRRFNDNLEKIGRDA